MRRSREPRTGYKFGFHGSIEHEKMDREATVDDILESLGRHTQLADTLSMREAAEPREEGEDFFDARMRAPSVPLVVRSSLGRYAFSLMLVGGMVILVLYGFLSAVLGAQSQSYTAGRSLLSLIVSDPAKLGLLGVLCLIPVVMLGKRHRQQERLSLL